MPDPEIINLQKSILALTEQIEALKQKAENSKSSDMISELKNQITELIKDRDSFRAELAEMKKPKVKDQAGLPNEGGYELGHFE